MFSSFEKVTWGEQTLAMIVRSDYSKDGIEFFTPDDFSQQLAFMKHSKGKLIQPHIHNAVPREVHFTQEVLFIKKGRLRVDFYGQDKSYLDSRILGAGDIILLADCGHGFEVLDDLEMIEVKQGPYAGEADKVRFDGIPAEQAIVKGRECND
mgnify:CR=1 FL=1